MSAPNLDRLVVDPFGFFMEEWILDYVDRDDLLHRLIAERAGNAGLLVHHNDCDDCNTNQRCPFCGCRSWFSFLETDDEQGADVFECLRCLATITRRDVIGEVEWKAMQERMYL